MHVYSVRASIGRNTAIREEWITANEYHWKDPARDDSHDFQKQQFQ